MDHLSWLWQDIVADWVKWLLGIGGGGVVMVAVKKWWATVPSPALYALSGAGIAFVCLFLLALSDRALEQLKQEGDKQAAALATFASEQKGESEQLAGAFEQLASVQIKVLDELAKANPTRPYFTQSLASIYKSSSDKIYLTVSVQNNNVPAEDVVSHLLVIEEALDANSGPLHSNREESANPVGPGGTHSHHWGPVNVPPNAHPAFIVLQVQYTNALNGDKFSQALFLMFHGSQDGTFITQLYSATSDQKAKIERYMEKRGISSL